MILRYVLMAFIGFSGGIVVAGAVFAFITIIGIVPRLVQKTKTKDYIILYENCIVLGGILGTIPLIDQLYIPFGQVGNAVFGTFAGIFIGCLAVSLAEVIDVIPILSRRARLKTGLQFFLLFLAIGKMIGSLLYFLYPGFMELK